VDKLPDYLAPGLDLVICGTAAGTRSAAVGGYYAGTGNEFWGTLHQSGLIPVPLGPSLSHRVLEFGIGLTDLLKARAQSHDQGLKGSYDVERFVGSMERYAPTWIAFHGMEAGKVVSGHLGHGRAVSLGTQGWLVGVSRVFVLPSMSGANRGTPDRERWFVELGELLRKKEN
jgi:TDG/mug DNA glycosylase family protein